jgi:hypothetical protein
MTNRQGRMIATSILVAGGSVTAALGRVGRGDEAVLGGLILVVVAGIMFLRDYSDSWREDRCVSSKGVGGPVRGGSSGEPNTCVAVDLWTKNGCGKGGDRPGAIARGVPGGGENRTSRKRVRFCHEFAFLVVILFVFCALGCPNTENDRFSRRIYSRIGPDSPPPGGGPAGDGSGHGGETRWVPRSIHGEGTGKV